MAAIDDLIAQIDDGALRARLKEEADRLRREQKFGLVFEEHLPELTPVYSAPLRAGSLVAQRGAALTDVWRVLQVQDGQALCLNRASGVQEFVAVAELVVVLEFGEPIFPALTPLDRVQHGADDAPWHTLIEADNYHALQLLEYLYAGQVDCIYIDPPYNTGARDWKYNNDFVDGNDVWRHSKWLAFMKRRLRIAKRLLSQENGVLIVTIDEHEVYHLGCLIDELFPDARRQMITIVNNAAGVSQGGFYRVEEYAFVCFLGTAKPVPIGDDLLSDESTEKTTPIWFSLIRYGGINALPSKRPGLVYPIAIDPENNKLVATGTTLAKRVENGEIKGNLDSWRPDPNETVNGLPVIWPFRENGSLSTWQLKPSTLLDFTKEGFVRIRGQSDGPGGNRWSISYIKSGNQAKIKQGIIPILGYEGANSSLVLGEIARNVIPKTVWRRTKHDAGKWGSRTVREILGNVSFDYAKSPYAVRDTLATAIGDRRAALVIDFFAGSGTTLHALELLNYEDNGRRRCILVTNNEVSERDAKWLVSDGYSVGDPIWEQHGVCRAVTWPRAKYTILGRRDDGTRLEGDYLTGRTTPREKARTFRQLSFVDPATLTNAARKREVASLIDAIPGSQIKADDAFFVSSDERHTAAILFDDVQGDAFLDALDGMEHITHFYIVTQNNKRFRELKAGIEDLLGPIEVQEEEKRPLADGFPANLAYFRLDFLDKDQVALGRQFAAILPLLWLRAGAVGARPELPVDAPLPELLIPPANPFAVLVDERRFAAFQAAVAARPDLTHIFLVTDSDDAFQEMAAQLAAPHVIQLYRDYLENFMINRGESR